MGKAGHELDRSWTKKAFIPFGRDCFNLRPLLGKLVACHLLRFLLLGAGFHAELGKDVIDKGLPVLISDISAFIELVWKCEAISGSIWRDFTFQDNEREAGLKSKWAVFKVEGSRWVVLISNAAKIPATQRG